MKQSTVPSSPSSDVVSVIPKQDPSHSSGTTYQLPLSTNVGETDATTTSATTTTKQTSSASASGSTNQGGAVDFVGPNDAVKDLFSLPYLPEKNICVAVHNIKGTLLIDANNNKTTQQGIFNDLSAKPSTASSTSNQRFLGQKRRRRMRSRPTGGFNNSMFVEQQEVSQEDKDKNNHDDEKDKNKIIPLSTKRNSTSDALALVSSMLVGKEQEILVPKTINDYGNNTTADTTAIDDSKVEIGDYHHEYVEQTGIVTNNSVNDTVKCLPPPEFYADPDIVPDEPREYLSWKFQNMKMIVGSNALIYRNNNNNSNTAEEGKSSENNAANSNSRALAVRVADAEDLRLQLKTHVTAKQQHSRRLGSYAEALLKQQEESQINSAAVSANNGAPLSSSVTTVTTAPTATDLDHVHLQTCIIPTSGSGSFFPSRAVDESSSSSQFLSTTSVDASSSPTTTGTPSSPISTVMDAYLDNIMANVPQLALCLREKGFIQSVKLLQTEDIPSTLMHPSTLDMQQLNVPAPEGNSSSSNIFEEPLFSPRVMEMNASMLLNFLKNNCNRDNRTYLLCKDAGQTNIQLYDITSISEQRQRKWLWWLATMSYRFALRLGHLSTSPSTAGSKGTTDTDDLYMKRTFRARQRSLLQTSLDLLIDLHDMDGGAHESFVAAVRESLADTFLNIPLPASYNENYRSNNVVNREASFGFNNTSSSNKCDYSSNNGKPSPSTSLSQPYCGITTDALNKAHDHLEDGIRMLWPIFERAKEKVEVEMSQRRSKKKKRWQQRQKQRQATIAPSQTSQQKQVVVVRTRSDSNSSSSGSDDDYCSGGEESDSSSLGPSSLELEAVTFQLLGLQHKLINVSLRLAEHHLNNYYSSSAMQSLRKASRRITDSSNMLRLLQEAKIICSDVNKTNDLQVRHLRDMLRYQFTWLWEYNGHFARSFAADELWRDRGHMCGDDIISLLRDIEGLLSYSSSIQKGGDSFLASLFRYADLSPISTRTRNDVVSLKSLSSITSHTETAAADILGRSNKSQQKSTAMTVVREFDAEAIDMAKTILDEQKPIKRDERRVLVAACVCYSRAIGTFEDILQDCINKKKQIDDNKRTNKSHLVATEVTSPEIIEARNVISLLQQRLGDACNEIGKILLFELRSLLAETTSSTRTNTGGDEQQQKDNQVKLSAADILLSSAQLWFLEGLHNFEQCDDLRNVALLRCNLCQCCKLRANNMFLAERTDNNNNNKAKRNSSGTSSKCSNNSNTSTHAESCLQEGADHLQLAHEWLGTRDTDPITWDMVSEELAATYLVLGVRRRQSLLLGGGALHNTTPVLMQALRLNPGKEHSIVDPMERSLKIYEQSGNYHQAAAVHYQLALFYSKVWTCQRDESKTREKLACAFTHFSSAHKYFSTAPRGNEPTFVILCLDLSNLYSSVSGEEFVSKALDRCIDTYDSFSKESINAALHRKCSNSHHNEWFNKMYTLATSVEDRVFKLLMNLVKLEKESSSKSIHNSSAAKYKELYRVALTAKMNNNKTKKQARRRGQRRR